MLKLNEEKLDLYREKVNAQIKEMKAQMMMLESEAKKSTADMRIKYQDKVDELKPRFEEIEKSLKELPDASEDAWAEIQTGINKSVAELQAALTDATKHFNN